MLMITGDIHGDAISRFSYKKNPFLRDMTDKDFAIILGDFGIPFGICSPYYKEGIPNEKYNLNFLESKKATILAVAGNHDDRNFIATLPQIEKFGGKVREMHFEGKHYKNIYYIDEPTVLTLDGKKCLFLPGAESHDIQDGIIDPWTTDVESASSKLLQEGRYYFRILDWDWWENEGLDIEKAEVLIESNLSYDYIFSHAGPLEHFGKEYPEFAYLQPSPTEQYFDKLADELTFTSWFHGHMHTNFTYNNNITCLYRKFTQII